MPEVLLAHAGKMHWYDYLLWLGPVVGIGAALLFERWRLRNHGKANDRGRPPGRGPED